MANGADNMCTALLTSSLTGRYQKVIRFTMNATLAPVSTLTIWSLSLRKNISSVTRSLLARKAIHIQNRSGLIAEDASSAIVISSARGVVDKGPQRRLQPRAGEAG